MPYYHEIHKLRKDLGLTNENCKVCGFRPAINPFDRGADLLVHTAKCEPFGMGIIEAMATGLPVVATRCGGPEEIIINGETGYLCNVGDYLTIAYCIIFLKKNPDIARKMGMAGYERVKAEFTYEKFIDSWRKVIQEAA
jgi:glycosyltransferase involved in cell wall biosynthesis